MISDWTDLDHNELYQTANELSFSTKGPNGKNIGDWLSLLYSLSLEGLDRRSVFYNIKNERPLLETLLNDILINGPMTLQVQEKHMNSGLPLDRFLFESDLDSKINT